MLPRYVSLVSLDMSQNHLGSDGAQRLSEALKTNSSLLELKYAASPRPYSADMCACFSLVHKCQRPLEHGASCDRRLLCLQFGFLRQHISEPHRVQTAQSISQRPCKSNSRRC